MKIPQVSVFLSYYNDADFLKSAIDSVLNQDFQDFELILLNHASTDKSIEIAHSYNDKRIIHIDKDYNYGAGCGLLIRDMLNAAHGKYIKLCCADDILHKDCLSVLVDFMTKHEDIDCVCSKMDFIGDNNQSLIHKAFHEENDFTNTEMLKLLLEGKNIVCYPTVMIRKSVLEQLPIDSGFIMDLDAQIWTSLLCRGFKMHRLQDKLISYRIHNSQTSCVFGGTLFLENIAFADIFNCIEDVNYIKKLCHDVPFIEKISKEDVKYFPFVFAVHNLKGKDLSFAINGYLYIHNLMNNSDLRLDVEKKFGFTVADFRSMYRKLPALQTFLSVEAKKLTVFQLLKLLIRRIGRAFAPKAFRQYFCFLYTKATNLIVKLKKGVNK